MMRHLNFSTDVIEEAKAISSHIEKQEINKRDDFRKILTFTIDPAQAKDFDDALSFRVLEDGKYEVGVHIADVTHYVKPKTRIDKEAYRRGTSVYFVDRVVPMLPEKLCNDVCSLMPNQDRLCMSVVFVVDDFGQVYEHRICRTVIHSDYRFNYEQVQEILDKTAQMNARVDDAILKLHHIAQIWRKEREDKGALNFVTNEVSFRLSPTNEPLEIIINQPTTSHQLVEEWMLMANKTVAETIENKGRKNHLPFVYRIHEMPTDERQESLKKIVKQFGYKFKPAQKKDIICHNLNQLFEDCKDKEDHAIIEKLILKTMAKARYSTKNIGHYGLLFASYTHFTSPIRRYPDMMVHRLLEKYLFHSTQHSHEKAWKMTTKTLEKYCFHCSEQEQVAMDAERKSIKNMYAKYYENKIGTVVQGVISGMKDFGIFVDFNATHAEGLISIRLLNEGLTEYIFDEEECCMRDAKNGKIKYVLGQEMTVKIKSVTPEKGWIDLELA